ncbi:MAG: nucleoside recognition domain-containing protein [Planctomycetota bacterium]|jgi:ferrous iron transport protein B
MTCETKTIAIIGKVGTGKTTLFEHICKGAPCPRKVPGCRVELSEALLAEGSKGWRLFSSFSRVFRARTQQIDVARGPGSESETNCPPETAIATLVDTPGAAHLFARGEDECATRNLLMAGEADVLVVVADAKNLRGSLVLFLQACEFQLPTVLVLNMTDEAQQLGLQFDLERLAAAVTVKITPLVAVEGHVLERMTDVFERAKIPSIRVPYPKEAEKALETLAELLGGAPIPPRALGLLLLAGDRRAEQMLEEEIDPEAADRAREVVRKAKQAFRLPLEVMITNAVYAEAERIAEQVTRYQAPPSADLLQWFGHYAAHPLFGLPIALLVILAGYYWVGLLGATIVVDYLNQKLFCVLLLPACERLFGNLPWTFVQDAILDPDFGLVPTGLFLALGIVLPVLFFFYTVFGLLEDSGYLPRLSVLLDRALRRLGLTGKGVLPLVFGFSCITTAILAARVLPTRKERIITSFLLLLGFPCAPMLAVMLVVLEPLPWTAAATLFGLLFVQVLVAGVLANAIMPGGGSDFILELSPIRIPRLWVVLNRARQKSWQFLKEALPAFMAASFLLFVLDRLGGLDALERLVRPVVNSLLGLPDQSVRVFMKTMIRRENGAAELTLVQNHFNSLQLVVTLFVMTVILPCVNSAIVLLREQGIKICLLLLLIVSLYAIVAGTGLSWVCQALGVTFH